MEVCPSVMNFAFAVKDKQSPCKRPAGQLLKTNTRQVILYKEERVKLHRLLCMSHSLANFLLPADFLDVISEEKFDKNVYFMGDVYIYVYRTAILIQK